MVKQVSSCFKLQPLLKLWSYCMGGPCNPEHWVKCLRSYFKQFFAHIITLTNSHNSVLLRQVLQKLFPSRIKKKFIIINLILQIFYTILTLQHSILRWFWITLLILLMRLLQAEWACDVYIYFSFNPRGGIQRLRKQIFRVYLPHTPQRQLKYLNEKGHLPYRQRHLTDLLSVCVVFEYPLLCRYISILMFWNSVLVK